MENIYRDKVLSILNDLDIKYEKKEHDAFVSMEEYETIEKEMSTRIPKNLFLCNRQETMFYLLIMPGDKVFKTKEISAQINSARLSFGNEERLFEYLKCHKGSTSVFGLLFDEDKKVSLLIDEDILKEEYLGFHPCDNSMTIKIRREDLIDRMIPYTGHSYQVVHLVGE